MKFGLKKKKRNESKALNWSLKPLETLQISAAQDGKSGTLRLSGDDVPRSRAVFFMVSVAVSLENVCELNKKNKETPRSLQDFISEAELFTLWLWGERGDNLALDASCKALCSSF